MKSYHKILLILLIANIAFVNSKRELKILSKEELKFTESRTEKSRHDTIEDVFDDQIFLFESMKQFDSRALYEFDSRWFLPSIVIVDLGSKYYSLDERRFILHDTRILDGSLWVNRTIFKQRNLFNLNSDIRKDLRLRKDSGKETGKQVFRKYVINPLLNKGKQFQIEIILDLLSESPLVASYLGGYVTESKHIFRETVYDDRCAHFMICDSNEINYYSDYKQYFVQNFDYDSSEITDLDNRIQATVTYTLEAIKEGVYENTKGEINDRLSQRNLRVKFMGPLKCFFMVNKFGEVYLQTCKVAQILSDEWKKKILDNNRNIKNRVYLINENLNYNYLHRDFDDSQFARTMLMEKFRAKVAYISPSPFNIYFQQYFEANSDTWIVLTDQATQQFTLEDVYDADFVQTGPQITLDLRRFRTGLSLQTHMDHSQMIGQLTNLVELLREYDELQVYPFNSEYFTPKSFILNLYTHEYNEDEKKVLALPQGKGVWLLRSNNNQYMKLIYDLSDLKGEIQNYQGKLPQTDLMLRQYVIRPLLVEGRMFILRTYAFIVSSSPFILLSKFGYARFGEEKFDVFSEKPFSNIVNEAPQINDDDFMSFGDLLNLLVQQNIVTEKGLQIIQSNLKNSIAYIFEAVFDGLDQRKGKSESLRLDFKIDQDLSPYLMNIEPDSNSFTPNKQVFDFIQTIENEFIDMVLYSHDMNQQRKNIEEAKLVQICKGCTVLQNDSNDYSILNHVMPGDFKPNKNIQYNQKVSIPSNYQPQQIDLNKEIHSEDL